jgi:hypothetical protein
MGEWVQMLGWGDSLRVGKGARVTARVCSSVESRLKIVGEREREGEGEQAWK